MVGTPLPKQVIEIVKYVMPEDITGDQSNALFTLLMNRIESVITGNGFNRNCNDLVATNYYIPTCYFGMEDKFIHEESRELDEMFYDLEQNPAYVSTLSSLARSNNKYYEIANVTANAIYIRMWNE